MKNQNLLYSFTSFAFAAVAYFFWLSKGLQGSQSAGLEQPSRPSQKVNVTRQLFELAAERDHEMLLQSKSAFIMYYAPWCNVCEEVLPIFESVQRQLWSRGVASATVDCVKYPDICTQDEVPIFPTIKLAQHGEVDTYHGKREPEEMLEYVFSHV